MHRGSLGTRRRDERRAIWVRSHRTRRNGGDDEGDGGGAEGFGGGDPEFRELAEGIFWGWNPVADSEYYEEWLEQEWLEEDLEKESKELESEKAEYREFLKGLRDGGGEASGGGAGGSGK